MRQWPWVVVRRTNGRRFDKKSTGGGPLHWPLHTLAEMTKKDGRVFDVNRCSAMDIASNVENLMPLMRKLVGPLGPVDSYLTGSLQNVLDVHNGYRSLMGIVWGDEQMLIGTAFTKAVPPRMLRQAADRMRRRYENAPAELKAAAIKNKSKGVPVVFTGVSKDYVPIVAALSSKSDTPHSFLYTPEESANKIFNAMTDVYWHRYMLPFGSSHGFSLRNGMIPMLFCDRGRVRGGGATPPPRRW